MQSALYLAHSLCTVAKSGLPTTRPSQVHVVHPVLFTLFPSHAVLCNLSPPPSSSPIHVPLEVGKAGEVAGVTQAAGVPLLPFPPLQGSERFQVGTQRGMLIKEGPSSVTRKGPPPPQPTRSPPFKPCMMEGGTGRSEST